MTPGLTPLPTPTPVPPTLTPTVRPVPTATPTLAPTPTQVAPKADTTIIIAHFNLPTAMDGEAAPIAGDVGLESMFNTHDFPVKYAFAPIGDGNFIEDTSEIVPGLYESWDVSPDGTVYTFKVRPDVISNYGNLLTADTFKAHATRYITMNRIWAFVWRSVGFSSPDQVVVKDASTVEYTLPAPNSVFLPTARIFFHVPDFAELNKHLTADDEFGEVWLEDNSASFGPYQLTRVQELEEWEFERNPNYWSTPGNNARVIIREVPDASVRASLLQAGTIDIAWQLGVDELERLEGDPGVNILRDPEGRFGLEYWINMNNGVAPFDNPKVRMAIAHATPFDDIQQGVFRGLATRQNTVLRPIDFGTDQSKEWFSYDPAKARQLLAEGGYPDGFETSMVVELESAVSQNLAVVMKTALADVGIDMSIDIVSAADFGGMRFEYPKRYAMALEKSSRAIVPVGLYVFTHFFQPPGISCCNYSDYENPMVSEVLARGVAALTDDEAIRITRELETLIMEDFPQFVAAYAFDTLAVRSNISGHGFGAWAWVNWSTIVKE